MSSVEGLDNIKANLDKAVSKTVAKMNERVMLAGLIAEEAVRQQAELTDHSLEDLAILGHPYAKIYPADSPPHNDDSLLHIQSGYLFANIDRVEDFNSTKSSVAVGVSPDRVPYIEDLMHGNTKMRPRPFIQRAWSKHKDEVIRALEGRLGYGN